MRRLLVLAVLLLAGCGGPAAGADVKAQPSPTRLPAETAGGACQLLNFETVTATVGTTFDVAAASASGETYTCVLEQTRSNLPDLSLSVTPTQADVGIFKSTVVPHGATAVPDLGKYGYSAALAPDAGAGPAVEIGWLSGNQRIITLRLRTRPGTAPTDAAALTPKLVALAKQIDMQTV